MTHKAKAFKPDLIAVVEELLGEAEQEISSEEMARCKSTLNKIFSNFDRLNN